MRLPITLAFALLLATAPAAFAQTPSPPKPDGVYAPKYEAPTEVEEVQVRAQRLNWLLTFTIAGDVDEQSIVGSAPIGLNCGGEFFRWAKTIANRQCWLRVDHKTRVLLSAADKGRYGVDWTVQWIGCTPLANGTMCEMTVTKDATAGAVFTRLKPAEG